MTETDWVRRAVDEYEGPLLRYACRFVGDLERARDVVQDTFLRLCRQPRSEVEDHLAQWLFTVCRHRAVDICRKEGRMTPTSTPVSDTASSGDPGPSATLERSEAVGQILDLMEALPHKQQECIRLKFQEGLSYKEISGVTQLTVSHVGVLIHKGLKTLRARLAAEPRLA